jgi:hypothetical protein
MPGAIVHSPILEKELSAGYKLVAFDLNLRRERANGSVAQKKKIAIPGFELNCQRLAEGLFELAPAEPADFDETMAFCLGDLYADPDGVGCFTVDRR